jgi:hypothetical protein
MSLLKGESLLGAGFTSMNWEKCILERSGCRSFLVLDLLRLKMLSVGVNRHLGMNSMEQQL